ncbi:outer membrane protein [Pseudomonas aeruginosa]|nr:outer membrane protein [Pseudomonas aeruginosa]
MPGKATLFATLLACAALAGCADHKLSEQSLAKAQSEFDQVKEDSDVLRAAPKDVIRAGESLARAERLSSYWGSSSDVIQYAYLSQRYSEIARQHALLNLNQERLTRLQLERERLQLALREAKLLSVQEQGQRLSEEIASLSTEETERGLVLTLWRRAVRLQPRRTQAGGQPHRAEAGAVPPAQSAAGDPHRRLYRQRRRQAGQPSTCRASAPRRWPTCSPISAWIPRACRWSATAKPSRSPTTPPTGGGRRTAGWRSSSPTTRPAQRAALSPAPPQGAPVPQRVRGFFRLANRVAPDFSVRTCARAGYHRDRTSSSSNPCSISTLYFVITSREAQ